MNSKEIPVRNSMMPAENDLQKMQIIAKNAAASGLYSGVGSEQKIFMVLMAAQELGIKPMMALNGGLHNIQGKIEISSRLMSAMVRRSGHFIKIVKSDVNICILQGKRFDDSEQWTEQFTIEEAKLAGLIRNNRDGSPGMWMKWPKDMLYARALSRLARRLFADVIGTAYVEGEIRGEIEIISQKPEPPEDPLECERMIAEFVKDYPEENGEIMKAFLIAYAGHYGKRMDATIEQSRNSAQFIETFKKWERQQQAKIAAKIAA